MLVATLDANRVGRIGQLRRLALGLALKLTPEMLQDRGAARVEQMLAAGLEAEVRTICARHALPTGGAQLDRL